MRNTLANELNLYNSSTGERIEGKLNVKFSPTGSTPSFQLENSYKITDKKEQKEILQFIMDSSYYDQSIYQRTLDSMLIEWKAHNNLYSIYKHERVQHTDFDKNDEGVTMFEFYLRAIKEYFN